MRKAILMLAIAMSMCFGFLASRAVCADDPKMGGDKPGGMDMSKMTPDQMKDMMKQLGAPGPEHERMVKQFGGTWNADVNAVMAPGAPPDVSTGTMTTKPVFGGRYLHQMFKGKMMGEDFEGAATMGYDKAMKKYVGTWVDSMSTGMMTSTGDYDEATKTYNMTADFCDPMSGQMMKCREVITVADDDHHMMEMYGPGPDGKEMKMMTIKYTRAK
jgi:hypothetical protein